MKKRELTPIGKLIVKRLIDLNKTQVWLCDEIGVSKSYLNRILHGERSGDKYMNKILSILSIEENEPSDDEE